MCRFVPAPARCLLASLLAVALALAPLPSQAQTCDEQTEARLEFLESRLEEGQSRARLWWRAWMGVFVLGTVWGVANGATTRDGSNAAADYINAGKSIFGIANLTLRPHVARHGATRVRAIEKSSPEACRERLALAEKSLEQAAKQGDLRWNWKAHASSLALNLSAALAMSEGWDDPGNAWRDFAISTVSGELHIWTHPTRAVDDWSAYRKEFDRVDLGRSGRDLRLAAGPGGLRLSWSF